MRFSETQLSQCFVLTPDVKKDNRGWFVKTYTTPDFSHNGLDLHWKESFYTVSKKNVLRGLHFQVPPSDHHKLVGCVKGEILDVVVDLRRNSPTFQKVFSKRLNESTAEQMIIPKGLAHGFLTLSDEAVVVYNTTHPYSPKDDKGILWNSIDMKWPVASPLVSERDAAFPPLHKFDSPFTF